MLYLRFAAALCARAARFAAVRLAWLAGAAGLLVIALRVEPTQAITIAAVMVVDNGGTQNDPSDDELHRFDLEGNHIQTFSNVGLDNPRRFSNANASGEFFIPNGGNNTVSKFDFEGNSSLNFATSGTNLVATAFDSDGNVVVADTGTGDLFRHDPVTGAQLGGAFLNVPQNLGVTIEGGTMFITERAGTDSVRVFDEGTLVEGTAFAVGLDTSVSTAIGPDVGGDGGSTTPDGVPDIFVSSVGEDRVAAFSGGDRSEISVPLLGTAGNAIDLATLPDGSILIADTDGDRVLRFDGTTLVVFGDANPAFLAEASGVGVFFMQIPEPSSGMLAGLSLVALRRTSRRRSRRRRDG